MGLKRDLLEKAKEYKRDPTGQYWRHLDKMLNLHNVGKISKKEVLEHVREWAEK